MEQSNVFSTIKEFNKEYKSIREQILIRHKVPKNSKAKLVNAVMLYINFGDGFVRYTSNLSTMKEKIKAYELSNTKVTFKIISMV